MLRYVNDDEARSLLTLDDGIQVMEDLFRQEADGHVENLPTGELGLGKGFFRMKVGAAYGMNCYGFKAYGNGRYTVFVYNHETGKLDGIVEARGLTEVRTGAVSAVATKYMARANARTMGIIGTGREARAQIASVLKVRPLELVKAYSRSPERREAYAKEMSETHGIKVVAVDNAEACVREVDILLTITGANDPVMQGAWLEDGTYVCAVGATTPYRRELDDEAVARAGTVVVEHLSQAEAEIGELRHAADRGRIHWSKVRELKDLVKGYVPGRVDDREINLFDSIGVGAEDVAMANHVLKLARERGVGTDLPL